MMVSCCPGLDAIVSLVSVLGAFPRCSLRTTPWPSCLASGWPFSYTLSLDTDFVCPVLNTGALFRREQIAVCRALVFAGEELRAG